MRVVRRDDATFEIYIVDVDNNAVDITGGTVYFTVKRKIYDSDESAVIQKEITEFDNPEEGIAVLNLDRQDTDIPALNYFYDIQLVLDNKVVSSDRGRFSIIQDITITNGLDSES